MSSKLSTYMPSEWAKQSFVQLTWPHDGTDWKDMLDEATECFVNIARAIVERQKLLIVCKDVRDVMDKLGDDIDYSRINLVELPSNDTWARDHGGICIVENGKYKLLDFTFNGWGLKFASWQDNQLTPSLFSPTLHNSSHPTALTLNESNILAEEMKQFWGNYEYSDCREFILEGGSIESDGKGTILTTSECLLSLNRNHLSKPAIENKLKEYLGAERILWLNHGYLSGDDTDSHVDTLVRFCPDDTLCYVQCTDETDEHYNALKAMEEELKNFRTLDNKPYRLIALPMAEAVYDEDYRLPATYANFLIINGAVLVPVYGSEYDALALDQVGKAFPDHKIKGIDCNALIKQHGSLHCVTMQFPEITSTN